MSVYEILRLIGILGAIWGTAVSGWDDWSHGLRLASLGACVVAAAVSVGVAWAATRATRWIARAQSETLLFFAYAGTLVAIVAGGVFAGVTCRRLLDSI